MQVNRSDLDHLRWLGRTDLVAFPRKSVLDLGCGSGHICRAAMEQGAKLAVGIDIAAPEAEAGAKWDFVRGDLDGGAWLEILDTRYDVVTAFDIIEHLRSPFDFLVSCRRVLEPSGCLVLTTANVNSWERFARRQGWSGAKDEQHKTLFTKYSLCFLLERAGFRVDRVEAPIRTLEFLGPFQPPFGGQIFCVSSLQSGNRARR